MTSSRRESNQFNKARDRAGHSWPSRQGLPPTGSHGLVTSLTGASAGDTLQSGRDMCLPNATKKYSHKTQQTPKRCLEVRATGTSLHPPSSKQNKDAPLTAPSPPPHSPTGDWVKQSSLHNHLDPQLLTPTGIRITTYYIIS